MAESDAAVSDQLVPRRRRDRSADRAEALIKLALVMLVFLALAAHGQLEPAADDC